MHSFHQSRGIRLFDFLGALAISASLAGAWLQTGASALLAASGVALLHALVHGFGRKGNGTAEAVAVPEDGAKKTAAESPISVPRAAVEPEAADGSAFVGEEEPKPRRRARKAGAPRKAVSRRKSVEAEDRPAGTRAPDDPVTESGPVSAGTEAPPGEPDTVEDDPGLPWAGQEPAHSPPAPLFEPEPFVRQQQRAMFGRKAG